MCTACALHVHCMCTACALACALRVHCVCMCMCTAYALPPSDGRLCTVQAVATLVGATLPKLEAHFNSLGVPLEILASQARYTVH
jgi:hypothetical protein